MIYSDFEVVRDSTPVAGSGKRTRYRNYLRAPRSTAEKRSFYKHEVEASFYGFKIRASRNARHLPNYFDDNYRSDLYARSWKHNKDRKHQWK